MTDGTDKIIDKLVDALHAQFDWKLIPDPIELAVLKGLFHLGIGFLPPAYVGYLTSAADGIDDHEADDLKAWLVSLMDKYGSSVPSIFRSTVAGVIVDSLRKGVAVAIS